MKGKIRISSIISDLFGWEEKPSFSPLQLKISTLGMKIIIIFVCVCVWGGGFEISYLLSLPV